MGIDILGIDIMGVDILGIDILALPHVYIILLYNSVFKIHYTFNFEEHVLQIAYRNVNYIVFYCACMIMYKAVLLLKKADRKTILPVPRQCVEKWHVTISAKTQQNLSKA